MAASEFVELELESGVEESPSPSPSYQPSNDDHDDDNHRFLDDNIRIQHSQGKKVRLAAILIGSLFCFVILLLIILVATNNTTSNSLEITQICTSPIDSVVKQSTLYRLHGFYLPVSYSIFWGFNSNLQGNTTASVDIQLHKTDPAINCDWIWLNTDATRIFDLTAQASTDTTVSKPVSVLQIIHHPTIDVVGIQLSAITLNELKNSNKVDTSLILHLNYRLDVGQEHLDGLYISKWKKENGQDSTIVASQMEATSARRALPCIDQPNNKATFHVSIGCRDCTNHAVLSNMPESIKDDNDNQIPTWSKSVNKAQSNYATQSQSRVVSFAETPKMSTYLLAITIGELDYLDTELILTKDNKEQKIQIKIYTTKGSKELGKYALNAAKIVLELYQKNFNINFPLPKCDMVAIPDFAAGAMENWGLVLYRETALLVDPLKSSDADKQRVAVVVAHELAHQWFGNLVTMKWWNDLWLNEGFATYTEYQGTNAVDPSFNVWSQFLRDVSQPALQLDGTNTATHALHQDAAVVATPGAIEELFDTIDYSKGGAVVRMVATALDSQYGKGVWSATIENYLNLHKYDNAEANDLWNSASNQVDPSLNQKLTTWSNQIGFPLVTATVDNDSGKISLSQTRYFNSKENQATATATTTTKWWIPITYVVFPINVQTHRPLDLPPFNSKSIKTCEMNVDDTSSCNAVLDLATECVKINMQSIGFYRVHYPTSQWNCLLNSFSLLPTDDRSGLIDDVFSIAKSNSDNNVLSNDYNIPLSFANKLKYEKDLSVWSPGLSHVLWINTQLASFVEDPKCSTNANTFLLQVIGTRVKELGIVPVVTDDHLTRLLRIRLVSTAVIHGEQSIIDLAKSIYQDPTQKANLTPDEQSIIYKAVVRNGDVTIFNEIYKLYMEATFAPEKKRYMYALASTRDPVLIDRVLNMAIDPNQVRSQDTVSLLASVGSYSEGSLKTWEFVKKNWKTLYATYGSGGFALTRLVLIASNFGTQEMLNDITTFFNEHPVPAAERAVARAKEEVEDATNWSKKNAKVVCAWLSKN